MTTARFCAALLGLVMCGAVSGQPAASAGAGATPAATASVSGVVTNKLTGEPILRAHVVLGGSAGDADDGVLTYGALTDMEGKFSVTGLLPGEYVIYAYRIGFLVSMSEGDDGNGRFKLSPGEKREDMKITLTPAATIVGRVLDSAGEPVAGAMVQAEASYGNVNVTADEQGRYRIGSLHSGKYRVRAAPQPSPFPSEIRTDGSEKVHHSPTYYPGSLTRASGQRLAVSPGAELSGIDIRLIATPMVRVSGRVSGMPGGNARTTVRAIREGKLPYGGPTGIVKPDGSFTISSLDPGKYMLVAESYGRQGDQHSAPVEIEVAGANLEHVELRMMLPFNISGQLRFDDERVRLPQSSERAGQPAAQVQAIPRRISLQEVITRGGPTAEIGADDTFTLKGLSPGRYSVALSWGLSYVRSVRIGETETEGDVLDLRNRPTGSVTITISALTCKVSGTVNGSNGAASDATVVLLSEAAGNEPVRSTSSNSDGTYQFDGLPPGKYKLAAVDDNFAPMARAGTALEDYADVTESIDLRPGERATRDLKRK